MIELEVFPLSHEILRKNASVDSLESKRKCSRRREVSDASTSPHLQKLNMYLLVPTGHTEEEGCNEPLVDVIYLNVVVPRYHSSVPAILIPISLPTPMHLPCVEPC